MTDNEKRGAQNFKICVTSFMDDQSFNKKIISDFQHREDSQRDTA